MINEDLDSQVVTIRLYHNILTRALSLSLWFDAVNCKPTFISIFAFLRPHDLMKIDSTKHLVTDEKVHQEQREYHNAPHNVDSLG